MSFSLFNYQQNKRRYVWQLYVKFIEENTDGQQKNHQWNDIRFFCWRYVIFIKGETDRMKHIIFFARFYVSKSIDKLITDGCINISQISDEIFLDRLFFFISSSGKFMLANYEYKYWQNMLSVNLKILVVGVLQLHQETIFSFKIKMIWSFLLVFFLVQ